MREFPFFSALRLLFVKDALGPEQSSIGHSGAL